ncbi:hypothetical protein ACQRBN_15630 [Bariatricus sp. SGI.154]|uniref:hypothetical protein n=1 Tax=Bariatricus sp. SGI.154 TaxID=3420549 RepID=UPI003CFFAF8C
MLNYIKSEWYQVLHSKNIYIMTAILSGGTLLMNIILCISRNAITDFPYGTFRFSLNTLTAVPSTLIILGAVVAACVCTEDLKNGVLKNAVSYGISRPAILLSKCIISLAAALITMIITLVIYIGSAYLLLVNPESLPLRELLTGIGAVLPCATAFMVLMIVLRLLCLKEMIAVIWWVMIYYLIPMICFFVGLKVDIFERISEWMPYIFLKTGVMVTMNNYQCLWDTSEGLTRCIVAGFIGIIVFLTFGVWKYRKQEF